MNFQTQVLPYIQKDCEPLDSIDKKMIKQRWKEFEKLSGTRRLIEEGYTESVLEIFNFAVSL